MSIRQGAFIREGHLITAWVEGGGVFIKSFMVNFLLFLWLLKYRLFITSKVVSSQKTIFLKRNGPNIVFTSCCVPNKTKSNFKMQGQN